MEEPSILDYLKSKLNPWRQEQIELPILSAPESAEDLERSSSPIKKNVSTLQPEKFQAIIPWRGLAALFLALLAQFSLRPSPGRAAFPGVIFLVVSFGLVAWAAWVGELKLAKPEPETGATEPASVSYSNLLIGFFLALVAFVTFGSLQFSFFNLLFLGLSLGFILRGFWIDRISPYGWMKYKLQHSHRPPWQVTIRSSTLLGCAALALAAFFRFYRLGDVPPEMNSDHAEKFLDVLRVLSGQTMIFFSNNGGREALQFYLVSWLHRLTGILLNFMILKLVTSAVGFLALPFIYLIGKELGSRRAGLLAFVFAGIAYWPNVVSRVGLRLPFYMLFTAALFYTILRGLRRGSQNTFIAAGIILGLGLYGYSADRILPLLVITAIGLYIVHRRAENKGMSSLDQPYKDRLLFGMTALLIVVLVSMVIFMPLLRYILADPEGFFMRTFTRMGSWEKPIGDSIPLIFLKNSGRALAMFSWDAGVVWPISIPGYPALSLISGSLFYFGIGLVLVRYLRQRDWQDLLLLISIPILLLPSILALAFPNENPNLYRTGGAIVPVFLLIGFALDSLMTAFERGLPARVGKRLAISLALLLLAINGLQDYNLVFDRYYNNYRISAWNSSEMGAVVQNFIGIHRVPDNVWVIGYPNWVDTRLVANNAGFPGRDYELKIENIPETVSHSGPKLFILNPQDQNGLDALQQFYPKAWIELYSSQTQTKEFLIFTVLPEAVIP